MQPLVGRLLLKGAIASPKTPALMLCLCSSRNHCGTL